MDFFTENYKITQGDDFYSNYFYIDNGQTGYVDLSTYTIKWGIKESLQSPYIDSSMPINVEKNSVAITIDEILYPINTLYRLKLANSLTDLDLLYNKQCFLYEVEMTDLQNQKLTLQKGEFEVTKQLIN